MSKVLIIGFMLAALLAIVIAVVACTPEEPVQQQPTGVTLDIDGPKKPKSKPAPKTAPRKVKR